MDVTDTKKKGLADLFDCEIEDADCDGEQDSLAGQPDAENIFDGQSNERGMCAAGACGKPLCESCTLARVCGDRATEEVRRVGALSGETGMRLDAFISEHFAGVSRSYAKKLIEAGAVYVDGRTVDKPSFGLKRGAEVAVVLPQLSQPSTAAEDIPLNIVYEDSDLAVIDKQQGLTVHPANGVYSGTLVNALLFHIKDLSGINGCLRPGIVHRLDKDTSGLMLVAKNDVSHRSLAAQIASKECRRIYLGLAEGVVKEGGIIDKPIARSREDRKKMAVDPDGRAAQTMYSVITGYERNTLLRFELTTGRTHQIRVHAKYMGHPIVGDPLYGYKNQRFNLNGQLLHSSEIFFRHPADNREMHFLSDLPPYFKRILALLR